LEEAALAQETDNLEYEKDLVNLMTLHAVKGLEFSVVFIVGCEQGLLPHSRALFGANENEFEEERRLCYVGVTRAKQKLYLTFAQRRMLFGRYQSNPPSEFLQNIPERLIEFIPAEEERVIELD
jgi:DNA helicase-2/ATP-dependent DNA helicase PcrA